MPLQLFRRREATVIGFESLVAEYLARHASQSRDYATHAYNTAILQRFFGNCRLHEITRTQVEGFVAHRLAEGVSRSTVNRQRACLSKLLNFGIDHGYLVGPNPVRLVKRFREPQGRIRFLSGQEAERLLAAANGHLKPIITVALHTGGRLSEILNLRWRDVDLERRLVYFAHTNTKSGRQREVPMSPELHELLSEMLKDAERRCPHCDESPRIGHFDGMVFTYGGRSIGTVRTAFTTARIKAGLGRDVTFHTLRHTFSSWFMINGGDLFRLQRFLGHSTIAVTQRYAHLSPDYVQGGVAFIGPPSGGSRRKDH